MVTSLISKFCIYFYHRTENASIFYIAKHASENKLKETVIGIEHGLDKHQTERKDASCEENVHIKTRLQKACNKLNLNHTTAVLKEGYNPQNRKHLLRTKKGNMNIIFNIGNNMYSKKFSIYHHILSLI